MYRKTNQKLTVTRHEAGRQAAQKDEFPSRSQPVECERERQAGIWPMVAYGQHRRKPFGEAGQKIPPDNLSALHAVNSGRKTDQNLPVIQESRPGQPPARMQARPGRPGPKPARAPRRAKLYQISHNHPTKQASATCDLSEVRART